MAVGNKFNATVANLANGLFNLGADTLKVMLTNTAPVAANSVYADLVDLATANGYIAGGVSLSLTSSTQSGGLYKYIASVANPTWTFSGAVAFRYDVVYDNAGTKPLLGWWDFGSGITTANGDTFAVVFDAVNGIYQLT